MREPEPDMTDFERWHLNCEAPWYCERCERPVCPRCDPSPGEFELCPECYWTTDEGGAA